MDNKALKQALEEVLDARSPVDKEVHIKHHEFIDELLDERKRKKERNEKIKTQIIGWAIISTIGGLLTTIGYAAYHFVFRQHGG